LALYRACRSCASGGRCARRTAGSHNGQIRGRAMLRLKVLTAAAVTVAATACASTASAAVLQKAPASGSVVSGDVHLALQAPNRVPLWVRLNGRVVTLPPPLRNGRIDLWLDPSDGLRSRRKRARGRTRREQASRWSVAASG